MKKLTLFDWAFARREHNKTKDRALTNGYASNGSGGSASQASKKEKRSKDERSVALAIGLVSLAHTCHVRSPVSDSFARPKLIS